MRLNEARPGEVYRVVSIRGTGMVKRRIQEMGIVPGVRIRILGEAPLGDPMDIEVNGVYMSIRKKEAEGIEVERIGKR